jgi:hypothetical protein
MNTKYQELRGSVFIIERNLQNTNLWQWTDVKEVRASSTHVNKLMSKKLEHLQLIYGQWIDVKEVRAYPTDDL